MDGKRARDQFDPSSSSSSSQSTQPKRPRLENQPPSKVLHVRSLPPDTAEPEIVQLCLPFGRVVAVLLLSQKGQAFVQMEDVGQAMSVVQYYNSVHALVRGSVVFFQFSNRSEVTANNAHVHSNMEKQNRILLVSVSNLMYPITIDVLHRVFKKYGVILRIVTFTKGALLQALIEFDQVMSAAHAKTDLEGQNIYAGCCTLSIQFSNLDVLTVKFNNERSRDFTNPHLPVGSVDGAQMELGGYPVSPFGGPPLPMASNPMAYPPPSQMAPPFGQMGPMGGSQGPCVVIVNELDETRVTCDILFNIFGVYGDVLRVKILFNRKDTALVQYAQHTGAELACQHLNGLVLFGKQMKVNFSKHQTVAPPKEQSNENESALTKDYTNNPLHRFKNPNSKYLSHIIPPVEMLHVHNLPPNFSEEQIQSMFRKYGNVVACKIFENNRKMGLVQMGSVEEATSALIYMHGHSVEGSVLKVSFTKSKIR